MASPLRQASWEAYLRAKHGRLEFARKRKAEAADRAYARLLMERVEARRKAMLRNDSDS